MTWTGVKLNSGDVIPGIGFGTWKIPQSDTVRQITQAVEAGFSHIDTAQNYTNEPQTGQALRENGSSRSSLWITTKFSGKKSIEESIKDSVNNLGVKSVDLYLIHGPSVLKSDTIPEAWKKFEKIKADGLAKNIGVSNFNVSDLKLLLKDARIVPAANQILLHPYVYATQKPIIEFCHKEGITIEAYSPLIPVTQRSGGPVDAPLEKISKRTGASYDQILLAWNKAKGSIVLTSSSKASRLEGYVKAGDIELTAEEIAAIDEAGAKGAKGPPDSFFMSSKEAEAVFPKVDSISRYRIRIFSLVALAAVSLLVSTALLAGARNAS